LTTVIREMTTVSIACFCYTKLFWIHKKQLVQTWHFMRYFVSKHC